MPENTCKSLGDVIDDFIWDISQNERGLVYIANHTESLMLGEAIMKAVATYTGVPEDYKQVPKIQFELSEFMKFCTDWLTPYIDMPRRYDGGCRGTPSKEFWFWCEDRIALVFRHVSDPDTAEKRVNDEFVLRGELLQEESAEEITNARHND